MSGVKFRVGSEISCRERNFGSGAKFWVWEQNFMLAMKFRVRGENILEMGHFNAKKI